MVIDCFRIMLTIGLRRPQAFALYFTLRHGHTIGWGNRSLYLCRFVVCSHCRHNWKIQNSVFAICTTCHGGNRWAQRLTSFPDTHPCPPTDVLYLINKILSPFVFPAYFSSCSFSRKRPWAVTLLPSSWGSQSNSLSALDFIPYLAGNLIPAPLLLLPPLAFTYLSASFQKMRSPPRSVVRDLIGWNEFFSFWRFWRRVVKERGLWRQMGVGFVLQ